MKLGVIGRARRMDVGAHRRAIRERGRAALTTALAIAAVLAMAHCRPLPRVMVGSAAGDGPFCGMYCLFAALDAIGKPAPMNELIAPRFISSPQGSTAAQIKRAALVSGAAAEIADGLSADDLRDAHAPVILHVASSPRRAIFDHWILFLGVEDGQARVLDYPDNLSLWPFAELLSRWDGSGVIVADSAARASDQLRRWQARGALALAVCGLAAVLLARSAAGRTPRVRRRGAAARRAACIVSAAVALAFVHARFAADGLAGSSRVTQAICAAHCRRAFNEVGAGQLRAAVERDGTIIVDARYAKDFKRGHVRGAVNVPVNATRTQRRKALAGIARNAAVIVYCESDQCGFDDEVAADLAIEGLDDVAIFQAGWRAWSAANPDLCEWSAPPSVAAARGGGSE